MNRYSWMFLLLIPAVAVAAPQKVRPTFDREPYVGTAEVVDPVSDGVCQVSFEAPRGLVIETVSYRVVTDRYTFNSPGLGDFSDYEREAVVQVTTGGVTGDYHFPTGEKTYVWNSLPGIAPFLLTTAFSNTMSARLYPDESTAVVLSFRVNASDYSYLPELESCTLWVSGYRVKSVRSGLGP